MMRFALMLATLLALGCAPRAEKVESPIVAEIEAGRKSGSERFDHSGFDALLGDVVDAEAGRVDYRQLASRSDELDVYLEALASADLRRLGEAEQLALFINAYNAYTLRLILNHYPLDSIKDLDDPWGKKTWKVAGESLSLDDIEHGILRPIFRDERIHFAVNCASISCPPLAADAFDGAEVDAQLDGVVASTLRNPRYAAVRGDSLVLTRILSWYGKDFVDPAYHGHATTLPAWISRHGPATLVDFIAERDGAPPVDYFEYDWRLNDVAR